MDQTMFLIARPSLIEGIARLIDFGDTLTEYNYALDGQQADELALRADLIALGNDVMAVDASLNSGRGLGKR